MSQRRQLGPRHFELAFRLPQPVSVEAGQFLMVRAATPGWDPLLPRAFSVYTVADHPAGGRELGICFRVEGRGTATLSALRSGDQASVFGPLGVPFRRPPAGAIAYLIGGGIGFPPMMLLAEQIAAGGGAVRFFYGARTAAELIGLDRLEALGPAVLATDDGSRGLRGLITRPLEAALAAREPGERSQLYACGPLPLLQAVGRLGRRLGLPAQLGFEARMACGAGICRGCALPRPEGGYLMCCEAGPALDREQVDLERLS